MSTASKSPWMVAAFALAVGDRMLPRYGHRFSRHDFELSQLFACLVLRKFFRTVEEKGGRKGVRNRY